MNQAAEEIKTRVTMQMALDRYGLTLTARGICAALFIRRTPPV